MSETTSGTYILSLDLGEKLESLKRIGIDAPGPYDSYTIDIQSELRSAISESLSPLGVNVEQVRMADLSDSVIGRAAKINQVLDSPTVISTCPEIAYPAGGHAIEINRLVDVNGQQIGLGPRPGFENIDNQIRKITGNKIVIVEDGIFTGGTVRYLINKFSEAGKRVTAIVAGFNCNQADISWSDNQCYDLFTTQSFDKIIDWVPDHDFLPFIPGSGKVVGTDIGGNYYPFYDYRHATYAIPYIKPFGPISEWASIPNDKANKLSATCIRLAMDLFKTIENMNKKNGNEITIGHLLLTRQRTSLPMEVGSPKFPPLETKPSIYLADCL